MPKIKTVEDTKEQRKQVDDMFNHRTRAAEEEVEVLEEEKLEVEEEVEEEKPLVEEEEREEEEEKEPDDVVTKLRQRVAELETGKAFEKEEEEEEIEAPKKKKEPPVQTIEDFVTEEEFEAIQSDPRKLNEVLHKVYQRASADTSERVLKQIPEIVQASSARQMTLQEAVKKFYASNPDLQEHAKYVGYVANQIKAKNPEMAINDILDETEKEVRKSLAITKKAKEKEEERRKNTDKPAFARGSGNHKGGKTDNRNNFQKQADEMINSLNRR